MSASVEELIDRARAADRNGRSSEAAELWEAVRASAPNHPQAHFARGRQHFDRGDLAGAISSFRTAQTGDRQDPDIPLHLALAHHAKGEFADALGALDAALAIDPYFFSALLYKGRVLERMQQPRAAATIYRNAIKIAPPPGRLPPSLRLGLEHAQAAVRSDAEAAAAFLRAQTQQARAKYGGEDLRRFDECLDILAGVKRRQSQDPTLLYYPRLPPIPFFDREHFPWLADLEAVTETINAELSVVLREDASEFVPYIQYPPGAPVNQWVELNHSPSWSTFFLWRDGVRQAKNCARCPNTASLLERLPLAHQCSFGPTAMFSVLAPRTHIPPHTGSSNARLIVHLPLILPPECAFRVGNETRPWRTGEAWVFDDTIEHEAWNNSDQTRVVLIFDVWNPLLTLAERELVEAMMIALNEFRGADSERYSSQ